MSAPAARAAPPAPVPASASEAGVLLDYRDDGPLARALGRVLGPLLDAGPLRLTVLAVVPPALVLSRQLGVGAAGVSDPDSSLLLGGAVGWLVVVGGAASGRPHTGRLSWLVPPVLRATEYASLLGFALCAESRTGARAVPAGYALVAVLAFHHYDTVYRLRHQRLAPPHWLVRAGGGWDGRLLAGCALLALDALPAGLVAAAVALGAGYAAESTASWLRFSSAQRPALYADEEDEDE